MKQKFKRPIITDKDSLQSWIMHLRKGVVLLQTKADPNAIDFQRIRKLRAAIRKAEKYLSNLSSNSSLPA